MLTWHLSCFNFEVVYLFYRDEGLLLTKNNTSVSQFTVCSSLAASVVLPKSSEQCQIFHLFPPHGEIFFFLNPNVWDIHTASHKVLIQKSCRVPPRIQYCVTWLWRWHAVSLKGKLPAVLWNRLLPRWTIPLDVITIIIFIIKFHF